MTRIVKNPPAMWETRVRSLSREDPLEKATATHLNILSWRSPRTDVTVHGVTKSQDTTERPTLSLSFGQDAPLQSCFPDLYNGNGRSCSAGCLQMETT